MTEFLLSGYHNMYYYMLCALLNQRNEASCLSSPVMFIDTLEFPK